MTNELKQEQDLKNQWRKRLHGQLLPAVPIPMTRAGRLHEEGFARYLDWMARQGVGGVAVNVHTGRGLFIAPAMRRQVLSAWREVMGERLVIAGAGALPNSKFKIQNSKLLIQQHLHNSTEMAEEAKAMGADALLVFPPTLYRGHRDRDEWIVAYHRAIARVGLPLIVFYLYEGAGGITYTPEVLRRLFRIPEVVAVKMATLDSVMTFQEVSRLVAMDGSGVTLVTGEDRFLGYSLMAGARAALIGMGAAYTGFQVRLVRAWFRGESRAFLGASARVDRFAEATFKAPMEGYIQRVLWALAIQGVIPMEAAHDPFGPRLSRREMPDLRRALREIGR